MTVRRIACASFTLILMVGLAVGVVAPASADWYANFLSASASCTQGAYTIETHGNFPQVGEPNSAVPGLNNTSVEAWDSDNSFLGVHDFVTDFYSPGTFSGVIAFSHQPVGPVTFRLYYDSGIFDFGSPRGRLAEAGDTLADTITVPVSCGQVVSVPGCDQFISLQDAVVGLFLTTTDAYWKPSFDSLTNPVITIEEGKTLYVFGVDKSGTFAKVLLVCTFLWVPRGTVGPNPDDVWLSTPLPTRVVQ
jgi:hypothetical protein